ncbi:hypothetical protein Tsubulata_017450 [Turnera subulata]|uniref:XRRM domain-containing protein n=1 Tax=Turnera subulata TaxID=218843 RepID=A0A9Q0G636_9ROSI|nr:hypothetical protein Tsubulata_017450 [Turnera subulata]
MICALSNVQPFQHRKEFDAEREKEAEGCGNSRPGNNNKNHSNGETDYPKGLLVAFKLKSNSTDEQSGEQNGAQEHIKEDKEKSPESEEGKTGGEEASEAKATEGEGEEKASENPTKKDQEERKTTAAAYKNDMNVVMREDLKAVFGKFGNVKFVDFKIGEGSGYIRYENPEAAQKARAAAVLAEEHGLIVKNFIASLEPVTGDAEREYWSLLRGNQERRRENSGNRGGRGGKHFRGGGKHHRSRENESGRPNKARKLAAS